MGFIAATPWGCCPPCAMHGALPALDAKGQTIERRTDATSSGQGAALTIASWWHAWQDTASERRPFARMLPRVIGSIGSLKRLAAIRRL